MSRQDLEDLRRDSHSRGRGSPYVQSAPRARSDLLFLTLAILLGLAARLDFLIPTHFVIDADEAIVGLMAKHMSEGGPVPIFYYGQNYMGSLEPYLVSLVFRVFSISNEALKAVPLFFSLALIWVSYSLGAEFGGRSVARLNALLMAIPPVALTVWSAKARGGFIELVFLGAFSFLFTVRWLKDPIYRVAGILPAAFILGFGWWTNNQIIFFIVPTAFAVLSKLIHGSFLGFFDRMRALFGTLFWGSFFFLLGGLPFWIFNLENDFVSFQLFHHAEKADLAQHLSGLFNVSIPILLGAKHFWETDDAFPGSTVIAYSFFGVMVFSFICIFPRDMLNLFRLKLDFRRPVGLIPVFLVATCAIFSLSSFGYLVQAPRYLLPAYVGIFLMYALVMNSMNNAVRGAAPVVMCCALGLNLASAYAGGRAVPGEPIVYHYDRVASDHAPLIEFLNAHNYHWIRTNYWIGYRLAFETREQVRFLVFQEPHQTRIESYREAGRAVGQELMPLVLSPKQAPLVETALTALGYKFTRAEVGGYVVLHELESTQKDLQRIPADRYDVSASVKDDAASLAKDDNLQTRWGSGEPQKPGMEFRVELKDAQPIRGIRLDMSTWETDFPRGLQIEAELENGQKQMLLTPSQYDAALFYLNHNRIFSLMFPPVKAKRIVLTETGSDPVFDWSIAELEVEE